MVPLPSSEAVKVNLKALVRSSHALIGVMAIGCVGLFALARTSYPVVAYGAFGLFALTLGSVLYRYLAKGPEREHGLPSLTVSNNQVQIVNISSDTLQDLVEFVVKNRKPLPPPTGVIRGSATDPDAITLLNPEAAEALASQDMKSLEPPRAETDAPTKI